MGIVSRAMIYGRVASLQAKKLIGLQKAINEANRELRERNMVQMNTIELKAFKATYFAELESETKARRDLRGK